MPGQLNRSVIVGGKMKGNINEGSIRFCSAKVQKLVTEGSCKGEGNNTHCTLYSHAHTILDVYFKDGAYYC